MKYPVIGLVAVFLNSCDESHIEQIKIEEERIVCFINPEVPPSFPGGMIAMSDFIAENSKHPLGSTGCYEGRVLVLFTVDVDGSATDVKVMRGINESYNEEAKRLVKSFPKFEPGSSNGVSVPMRMSLPINFNLSN